MAIISVISRRVRNVIGDRKVTTGTYQATNGDIDTGLAICDFIKLQGTATAAGSAAMVNEGTFPMSGSAVTIRPGPTGGIWFAYGR